MSVYNSLQSHGEGIYRLAGRYKVTGIRVFGSVSHRQESGISDIDLLVDTDEDHDIMNLNTNFNTDERLFFSSFFLRHH